MVLLVYSIAMGFPLKMIREITYISSRTYTAYVKYVGTVCSDRLERSRRDPEKKYEISQWDETAFGRRKYDRGNMWVKFCEALRVWTENPLIN